VPSGFGYPQFERAAMIVVLEVAPAVQKRADDFIKPLGKCIGAIVDLHKKTYQEHCCKNCRANSGEREELVFFFGNFHFRPLLRSRGNARCSTYWFFGFLRFS
jgi:hypothetical protein